MCYSMFDKRSDAAKKSIENNVTRKEAEKLTTGEDRMVASRAGEKAYSGFMGRVQHWIRKEERTEKESAA